MVCLNCNGSKLGPMSCNGIQNACIRCGGSGEIPDLDPLVKTEPEDAHKMYGYKFGFKLTMDQNMRSLIEALEAGAEVTLTYPKGNRKRLKLEDV